MPERDGKGGEAKFTTLTITLITLGSNPVEPASILQGMRRREGHGEHAGDSRKLQR